ncbi:MAG: hypothetical protein ACREML_09800 [Vulcanimicrobiaceae bacterium]
MREGPTAGASSVPAAVRLEVYDADLGSMRSDFRRRHFGMTRPWMLVLGAL